MRYAALALAVLAACKTTPLPQAPPGIDAGSPCQAACARLDALGCTEAALASTCVDVCERASAEGLLRPACVTSASTYAELAACHVRCGP